MASYNRVIIAGNLTRDPEVRFLSNEQAVANFGLAMSRKFKDRQGNLQEEATFVDVECWGRTAELVGQYLTKGRGALVEGRLKLDQWEDQQGQKRSKLKIVAETVQFLNSGQRGQQGSGSQGQGGQQQNSATQTPQEAEGEAYDDEPPF